MDKKSRNTKKLRKKKSNKTKKNIFNNNLSQLSTNEILDKTFDDLDDFLELEEKSIEEIKPTIIKDLTSIKNALLKNKNGGYIVFGDSHHGDAFFDYLLQIYNSLTSDLQKILKNAYYFSENYYQLEDIKKNNIGKKFFGMDDIIKSNIGEDISKRNYQANRDWTQIILKNKNSGINIISVGRSHLYTVKGKKDTSKIVKIISFQNHLRKYIKSPITAFAMNHNIELNYDNYKNQSYKDKLDIVTNNPKIRRILII